MIQPTLSITGRQTSHFTRITRIYAEELGLDYEYRPIFELMSLERDDYDGNPALKMPVLLVDGESLYGAINICRELVHLGGSNSHFVWPENLKGHDLINGQELVLQAMATEVTLILARMSDVDAENAHLVKSRTSLINSLEWLESRLPGLLENLPGHRRLSLIEVTMYCLATHLEFRQVVPMSPYPNLKAFCQSMADHPAVKSTAYRVDVKS